MKYFFLLKLSYSKKYLSQSKKKNREKSTMIKRGKKYCNLSELKVNVGETKLLLNQKTTKILKVKTYNLLVYKKH